MPRLPLRALEPRKVRRKFRGAITCVLGVAILEHVLGVGTPHAGLSPIVVFATVLLGALVGSFLNVVILRMPEGQSIVHPPSHCPKCGDRIPPWLNVPILSWILLRGRCRACKEPISIRYPIVEAMNAMLWLAALARFGPSIAALSAMLLSSALVVITFVDLDRWEIPDEISLPGIVIGCALRPFAFDAPWYDGILGAVLGGGFLWFVRWIFWVLRKVEGMGFGDVKLIAMIGAFLGPRAIIPTILVASMSGSIIGVFVLLARRATVTTEDDRTPNEVSTPAPDDSPQSAGDADLEDPDVLDEEDEWTPHPRAVPFGPFLAIGCLAELFFHRHIDAVLRVIASTLHRWLGT